MNKIAKIKQQEIELHANALNHVAETHTWVDKSRYKTCVQKPGILKLGKIRYDDSAKCGKMFKNIECVS